MLKCGVFYDRLRPSSTWLMRIAYNFLNLSRVDVLLSRFMVYSPQPYSLSTVGLSIPSGKSPVVWLWKKPKFKFPTDVKHKWRSAKQMNRWKEESSSISAPSICFATLSWWQNKKYWPPKTISYHQRKKKNVTSQEQWNMNISFCQSMIFPSDASKRASILFFHPENGLNVSTNIKVRTVHFFVLEFGLYRVRTDHKEGPEGVKMGTGICLFMYSRKWVLLHWVWDLTIGKDISYNTRCLCPKTLLNLCFWLWEGVFSPFTISDKIIWHNYSNVPIFWNRREYSVPVDLSKHIRIMSAFYFLPSRPITTPQLMISWLVWSVQRSVCSRCLGNDICMLVLEEFTW